MKIGVIADIFVEFTSMQVAIDRHEFIQVKCSRWGIVQGGHAVTLINVVIVRWGQ